MAKSKMNKDQVAHTGKIVIAKYIRVSTDKQREEGFSIDIQKERLDGYAKSMFPQTQFGVEYREYVDDGFSGANLDRPRMQDLIRSRKRRTHPCYCGKTGSTEPLAKRHIVSHRGSFSSS